MKKGEIALTTIHAKAKERPRTRRSVRQVKAGRILLYFAVGLIVLFLLLPIVIIPLLSFGSSPWLQFPPPSWTLKWYGELFSSPDWWGPIMNSVKVGISVVFLSQLIGVPVSYALVRGKFPGRDLLNGLLLMPMIMPYIIYAIAVYSLFLKLGMNGTLTGLVITHTVLALPYVVINVSNAFRAVSPAVEYAAASCGAGPWQTFRYVVLPLIRPGVTSGAVFAFAISWDEVITSMFVTDPQTITLPVKIWTTLRLDLSPVIAALSTIMIALSTIMLVVTTSKGSADVFGSPSGKRE
ncbi:ABC transporter permease [Brevibacillus massiliensis]|uniref:ABC transporter permease n=1 Tax=Brevibacillus massiliensis TaxID=1118054 RepID=UPI0002F28133|nr:ABC transporter permease [Brevibacillus massiliensis]